jgi:hypothetical protein
MSITGANNRFSCTPVVFSAANQILQLGTITRDGNEFTFSVGFVWKINGVTYQNTAPVVLTIAEASEGFYRIDNAILNTSNSIELQQGLESETIALQPVVPDTNILLTSWNISGDTIGDEETPLVGTQFKQKNESQKITQVLGGTDAVIELRTLGQQHYSVIGPVTSIAGFSKDLITASPTAEAPYAGKDFYIENKTDHNVTLKNDFSPIDIPFNLGADLEVPTNGIVWLKYNPSTEKMDLFFKSWSEVDLSTKADLVDGKVPASQLPSYVDDVLEFANLSSFPVTGETGKIYLALDTNFTYRWSGSVYVQIGGFNKQIFYTPGAKYSLDTISSCYSNNVETGFASALINSSAGNMPTAMGVRWVLPLFISEKNQKLKEVNIRITNATFTTLRLVIFTGLSVNSSNLRINNQIIHDQNYTLSGGNISLQKIISFTNDVTIPIGYDLCFFLIRVDGTTGTLSNFQISGYAS